MKKAILGALLLAASSASAQQAVDLNAANFYWDWSQGTGGPVESFRIKCGPSTGTYTTTAVVGQPTARQYPVRQVIGGAGAYYCVITALNASGESPPSGEVFFVAGVTPSTPSNFRVAP